MTSGQKFWAMAIATVILLALVLLVMSLTHGEPSQFPPCNAPSGMGCV